MSEKPTPDFTLDEIAKEMARIALELWQNMEGQEPADKGDEGLTAAEYAELWGIGRTVAKKRIKKMRERGLMVRGQGLRKTKKDYWQLQPVYRPREEADGLQKTPE